MSADRPYGATCATCTPQLRKRFASETARQRWIAKHRADVHGAHTARGRGAPEIIRDDQTELDLTGGTP